MHHIFANHPRHIVGIFPDAHTSLAGHCGLELLRVNPMSRQDTATGQSQWVQSLICGTDPFRLVFICFDTSSKKLRLRPASSFQDGHRWCRSDVSALEQLVHSLYWSMFYAREIGTITQLSPFPQRLQNPQWFDEAHWSLIQVSFMCHEMRSSVKFFSLSLSLTFKSFLVVIYVRMFRFLISEFNVLK